MIQCPVQNVGAMRPDNHWFQKKPRITQLFGKNPQIYGQFKYTDRDGSRQSLKGHNGVDYGIPVGTDLLAPMSGYVKVKDSGRQGLGLHVKIRNPLRKLECTMGHYDYTALKTGQWINMCDLTGLSGNSGFSTGPHLHFGIRNIIPDAKEDDIFKWKVENYYNGFYGYFDFMSQEDTPYYAVPGEPDYVKRGDFVTLWKGTRLTNTL